MSGERSPDLSADASAKAERLAPDGRAVQGRAVAFAERARAAIANHQLHIALDRVEADVTGFQNHPERSAGTTQQRFGSRDQFGPAGKLEALVNTFADPKKLVRIDAGDHFFEGRLKEMRAAIEDWLRETVPAEVTSD